MASLEDVKRMVMNLSPEERREVTQWLAEYDPKKRERDRVADESAAEEEAEPGK